MILKSAIRLASGLGGRQRLSILLFHRVHSTPDPLFPGEVDLVAFDQILGWLGTCFNVLPLDEGIERLRDGTLPAAAAAITFDDGYADNLTNAVPVLNQHRMHATVFVATGFIDGGCMWNDAVIEAVRRTTRTTLSVADLGLLDLPSATIEHKRRALSVLIPAIKHLSFEQRKAAVESVVGEAGVSLPTNLMMRTEQLNEWHSAGLGVGAHTRNHPILAKLDPAQARLEIEGGRDDLQAMLGRRIGLFAYPNGRPGDDYLPQHVDLVKELGFDAAVSTTWGAASNRSDCFQLPRFTPWDRSRDKFLLRMLKNYFL